MNTSNNQSANAAHFQSGIESFNRQQLRICLQCDGTGYRTHWHGELKADIPCRFCQATGYGRDER